MRQRSVKFNAVVSAAKTVVSLLFPLITFPYTSRILGPEGTGKVNFANSFVYYFTLMAAIGIPIYGIREVSKVRHNKAALTALVQELLVMHGASTIVALIVLYTVSVFIGTIRAEATLFFIVSCSIPLSLFTLDWLYQGLEEFIYITIRSIVFMSLSVISLFVFVHQKDDYVLSAAIGVVSSLGSSVLNFWNARSIIFAPRKQAWNFKRHLMPLFSGHLLNFLISIYVNLDTVMLGFLSTAMSVGYYVSAMKLTKMLLAMISSFGLVIMPRLSSFVSEGRIEEFDKVVRKALGIIILMCLPASIGLIILRREIITVFAGPQYLQAASCITITAPIILVIGLNGIFGYQFLYTRGKEKQMIAAVSAGAVINVIVNLLLIPKFNHLGAAWGALIAESAILLIEIIMVYRLFYVNWPSVQSLLKYLLSAFAMTSILLLGRWFGPNINSVFLLSWSVPLGALTYFSVLFLTKEEFTLEIIETIIRKVKHGRV